MSGKRRRRLLRRALLHTTLERAARRKYTRELRKFHRSMDVMNPGWRLTGMLEPLRGFVSGIAKVARALKETFFGGTPWTAE